MFSLIETSEDIKYSLPIVGANIINIIKSKRNQMSIYSLLDITTKQHPDYGYERITQALVFLYTIGTIDLNGIYIEVRGE